MFVVNYSVRYVLHSSMKGCANNSLFQPFRAKSTPSSLSLCNSSRSVKTFKTNQRNTTSGYISHRIILYLTNLRTLFQISPISFNYCAMRLIRLPHYNRRIQVSYSLKIWLSVLQTEGFTLFRMHDFEQQQTSLEDSPNLDWILAILVTAYGTQQSSFM